MKVPASLIVVATVAWQAQTLPPMPPEAGMSTHASGKALQLSDAQISRWLDFMEKRQDSSALSETQALARMAVSGKDVFGLIANGPLVLTLDTPVVDDSENERPDPFPLVARELSVTLAVPDEQWCIINGREVYVGDVMIVAYEGERLEISLSEVTSNAVTFRGSGGKTYVRNLLQGYELTPASSLPLDLSDVDGIVPERKRGVSRTIQLPPPDSLKIKNPTQAQPPLPN